MNNAIHYIHLKSKFIWFKDRISEQLHSIKIRISKQIGGIRSWITIVPKQSRNAAWAIFHGS